MRRRGLQLDGVAAVASAAGSLALAIKVLGISLQDLRVPFGYAGDAVSTAAAIKSMVENGTTTTNPFLGMPAGAAYGSIPSADLVHIGLLRGLAGLTQDYALALNLFFLIGFPLVAITAYAALRALGSSRIPAVVLSVLYSVLPFHFMRGEGHLFLSQYWIVPLAVLVCVWVLQPGPPWYEESRRWRLRWDSRLLWLATGVCLVAGQSGVYWAFFTCFLLAVSGIVAAVDSRQWRRAISAALLIAIVSVSAVSGLAASRLAQGGATASAEKAERPPAGAEVNGLRVTQLLLPVTGHRIARIAALKTRYNDGIAAEHIGPNENDTATLGLLMDVGFVALLGLAIFRRRMSSGSTLGELALLNLASLLLATTAGLGAVLALVLPEIRGYNRISVFIAFTSAAAVALLLTRLEARWQRPWPTVAFLAISGAVLLFGAFDQTTPLFAVSETTRTEYRADQEFVDTLESITEDGAMIFQLPYFPYPENGPVERLPDYEPLKAYLHSRTLRWSYGAMRGSEADRWQRRVAQLSTAEFVSELRGAGFAGVWVDCRGYADRGQRIISGLETDLQQTALYSDDGTRAYFSLGER